MTVMEVLDERCSICGNNHLTECCSALENVEIIKDTVCLSRARLSLPGGLQVLDLLDGTTSVIARNQFKRGVQFGPLVAKISSTVNPDNEFPLKIFLDDEDSEYAECKGLYLNTTNEDLCNWMCLVEAATCLEDQNLYCFQMRKELYFLVIKDISPGDQLKVGYAPYYGIQMSAKPLANSTSGAIDDVFFLEVEEPSCLFEMDEKSSNKNYKKEKKKNKISSTRSTNLTPGLHKVKDDLVDRLPSSILGAKESKREWICSKCGNKESKLSGHAKHLMTHYRVSSSPFKCLPCGKRFKTAKGLEEHHKIICKNRKQTMVLKESNSTQAIPFQISTCENSAGIAPGSIQDNHIIPQDERQLEHPDVPHLNDLDSLAAISSAKKSPSQLLQSSGKDSFQKEYDILLESLNVFNCDIDSLSANDRSNDMNKKSPRRLVNNSSPLTNIDIFSTNNNENNINIDSLCSTSQSLRSKELESLNPPILNLGDEIVFQNIKSLTDIETVVVKSTDLSDKFSDNSLPIDQDNLKNIHLSSDSTSLTSTKTDQHLDPNDFLVLFCGQTSQVTDEDTNRIVDNLIKDSENQLNINVCDMNCDSELMKEMLNDDTFSTSEPAKNQENINPVCGNNLVFSENTPNILNISEGKQEKSVSVMKEISSSNDFSTSHPGKVLENDVTVTENNLSVSDNTASNMTVFKHEKSKPKKSFNCEICRKNFSEALYLYRHLRSHTGEFMCEQCLRVFARKENLQNHICTKYIVFHCKICDIVFKTRLELKKHCLEHITESKTNIIPLSDEQSLSKSLFKMKKVNGNIELVIMCEECDNSFDNLPAFHSHGCRLRASTEKKFVCEICGLTLSSKRGFRYHRSTHNSKLFSCFICDKKFHRKCILENHMASHQKIEKSCPICEKKFSKKSLYMHLKRHTGIRQYRCDICEKEFFQKSNLQKHQRYHAKEALEKRDDYNEKFQMQTSPSSPKLDNSEQTILKSSDCAQGTPSNLRRKTRQQRLHKEQYCCCYCQQTLHYKNSLRRHLMMKHQDHKEEWRTPGMLNSMRVYTENTDDAYCTIPPDTDQEQIIVDAAEYSLVTSNSDVISIQPISNEDNTKEVPLVNQLCQQMNDGFTLNNDNNQTSIDVIENQPVMPSIGVSDFMQINGNENTATFLLGDGCVVQSDLQLDKDLFYFVFTPIENTSTMVPT